MSSYPIAVFLFASVVWAQDSGTAPPKTAPPQDAQPPADASLVRKLESVTWKPAGRELSWVVSVWDVSVNSEQPVAKQDYTVLLDTATMKFNGEKRGFDPEEARQVRLLMDVISTYAAVSTVWWEDGQGEKQECPAGKDEKPKPSPQPASVVLPGPIAAARPLPQAAGPAAGRH